MKFLDKLIRRWRVDIALRNIPAGAKSAFDIGCDDGYLLNRLDKSIVQRDGIDPRLAADTHVAGGELARGFFPADLSARQLGSSYDVMFALAVFEHFSEEDLQASTDAINRLLSENGRLIVTVPHPLVDKILDVLMYLRLIDGQATEEHHGFDPDSLADIFAKNMRVIEKKSFQFGLNKLFIFGRK